MLTVSLDWQWKFQTVFNITPEATCDRKTWEVRAVHYFWYSGVLKRFWPALKVEFRNATLNWFCLLILDDFYLFPVRLYGRNNWHLEHPEGFEWLLIGHNYGSSFEKEIKPFQLQSDFEDAFLGAQSKGSVLKWELYYETTLREERERSRTRLLVLLVFVWVLLFLLCWLAGLNVGLIPFFL